MNNNLDNLPIPPIIRQYVENMVDQNNPHHVRENYRDLLDRIKSICEEAVTTFDKKRNLTYNKPKKR